MIGLYIHIPFCASKCRYCDFVSYPDKDELMESYIEAVIKEAEQYKGEDADTVFIGGGTPARLPLGMMQRLIAGVSKSISIQKNAEFTVEVNPNSVTPDKLKEYAGIGVNRISVGLQAAQEGLLKRLGRTHTLKDFIRSVDNIRAAGIDNINADMMYSLPGQTVDDVINTAKLLTDMDVNHVSAYSLILEEGTPLYNEHPVLPDDDVDRQMFYAVRDVLADKGIYRYEISNFAKKGCECQHNLKYWRLKDYVGIGVAAHSCYNGERGYNSGDIFDYLNGNIGRGYEKMEPEKESVMLKLRLTEGISSSELLSLPHTEELKDKLISNGLAKEENGRFSLTDNGMDIQNTIVSEFFAAMERF